MTPLGFRAAQSPVYKWLDLAILPVPMAILINILLGFYVFIALLMVLVILMQRPKSEGLGAAFGGGVTENIFGAQTTNVLTKITGWLAALFFLLTFTLSILYAHKSNTQSGLRRELMKDLPPVVAIARPRRARVPGPPRAFRPRQVHRRRLCVTFASPAPSSSPMSSAIPAASPQPSGTATPAAPTPRR